MHRHASVTVRPCQAPDTRSVSVAAHFRHSQDIAALCPSILRDPTVFNRVRTQDPAWLRQVAPRDKKARPCKGGVLLPIPSTGTQLVWARGMQGRVFVHSGA